jgi:hypothetical protein
MTVNGLASPSPVSHVCGGDGGSELRGKSDLPRSLRIGRDASLESESSSLELARSFMCQQ